LFVFHSFPTRRSSDLYSHYPVEPVETRFPMIETFREDTNAKYIIENEWGIKLPRMYELGFSHANCAGRCVRGGFQHYAQLYKIWPDQYQLQEEMEEDFREHFEKHVSILKKDGKPYTLKEYRERMDEEGLEKFLKIQDDTVPCVCSFS